MKYEIRIISEEDTVKSRTYEDLDKAIEIADKMFNDFVNTDFGDEIVIVEENSKDKKYYWANGKKIVEELKVGDRVKVVNSGATYSTYYDFILTYGTKQNCLGWEYGKTPSLNTEYKIVAIADHILRPTDGKLAIIEAIDGYFISKAYIIGLKGLQKIWTLQHLFKNYQTTPQTPK